MATKTEIHKLKTLATGQHAGRLLTEAEKHFLSLHNVSPDSIRRGASILTINNTDVDMVNTILSKLTDLSKKQHININLSEHDLKL